MGSPLSPAMANIYMEYFEQMPLEFISLKPTIWLKYVDDTFILWPHQEDVQILLDHVNSVRPSIQFTMEKESNNTFLLHRAKIISGDPETLDKELVSISSTLQRNNYSGYMAEAPPQKKWDRRVQEKEGVNNTQKTVCLPYVKGLSEKIQRICGP